MQAVAFKGEIRTLGKKKAANALRKEGRIPAVLYGGKDQIHFSTTHNAVKALIFTPEFKIADLNLDGQSYRCIVKDIQWHPVTDEILHIDFLTLVDGHPVKVELPVRFIGDSPGIRGGGKLQQAVRRIKVKANPENLVDELVLDITGLALGQSIRVRDIDAIDGIEVLNPPGTPVATVEVPRALRSAEMEEAKAAEDAEGEAPAEGEEEAGEE